MKPSAVIQIIWPLAAQEVLETGFSLIEPEHLFMAILRFADLSDMILRESLASTAPFDEIIMERELVRKFLTDRRIRIPEDSISLHMHIQQALKMEGGKPVGDEKIHRSQQSRRICNEATQQAQGAGLQEWNSYHLLEAIFADPSPAIKRALDTVALPSKPAIIAQARPSESVYEEPKPEPKPAPVKPSPSLASLAASLPSERDDSPGDRTALIMAEQSHNIVEPGLTVHTITQVNRENLRGQHAEECLGALLSLHNLISANPGTEELLSKIPGSILSLLPAANYVMMLKINTDNSNNISEIEPIAIVSRSENTSPAPPSRKMVKRTLSSGHPELHVWQAARTGHEEFTHYAGVGWALCSPIVISTRDRYVIYAAGEKFGRMDPTREMSVAVISMMAEVTAQYLKNQHLQFIRGQIAHYFPPALREIVQEDPSSSILKPSKKEVSILSFDIRGFSKATEYAEQAHDDSGEQTRFFLEHYHTVGELLSIVAHCVFDSGGIVIDYQGDAVLACWGAPLPMKDHAEKAVEAAMAVIKLMDSTPITLKGSEKSNRPPFGIGIASGEVIAGNMSAKDHLKYQVLGSTVNLASRIEGLTKYFGVPSLIAQETATRIGKKLPLRRVGKVRPAGMNNSLDLYDPVLSREISRWSLSSEQVETYHQALRFFEKGKLHNTEGLLSRIPPEEPVRRFLHEQCRKFLANGLPPKWDGVIEFSQK